MANVLITHDMIAQRALFELKNQLTFSAHVFKGFREEFHSVGRFQKGDTVRVELPVKYRTFAGPTLTVTDMLEQTTTVQVDVHRGVGLRPLATEWTQDIEQFNQKHIVPAVIALANYVDETGVDEILNVYNLVGTAGTTPSTHGVLVDAKVRMDNEAVPASPRVAVISPKAQGSLMSGPMTGLFNQSMVDSLIRKGFVGMYSGFDFFMDQNIKSVTTGTRAGTPLVKTQPAEGATALAIKGLGASETVKAGEVFTVATVAGVNPVSGNVWEGSELRQFVVTADATADGSGDITVSVSPTIYSSAATAQYLPYQTINDLPAVNDAITWALTTLSTAYPQNVMFHPDCFALTMVPFERPISAGESVRWGQASDEQIGLSIVVSTQFDITNYREATRLDILFGWDTVRPELGCRLTG